MTDGTEIVIGDFYGDAVAAVIDTAEEWCAIVGCGAIIYWLRAPFDAYEYDKTSTNWTEWHREGAGATWFDSVLQIGDRLVRLTTMSEQGQQMTYEGAVDDLAHCTPHPTTSSRRPT